MITATAHQNPHLAVILCQKKAANFLPYKILKIKTESECVV